MLEKKKKYLYKSSFETGITFPIAFWIFLTLKWQVSELEHFQLFLESYLKVGFLPQTSLFNNNCV